MSFKKDILTFITKYHLTNPGECVLIGVSGGPDSIALASILNNLKYELGITLHIAHLNHGLRRGAVRDETFVTQFAQSHNLPNTTHRIAINKIQSKGSLEEIARMHRFKFLTKTAHAVGANKIALGHNQDDLAETVIMRILRGTGIAGIRAIRPMRTLFDYPIIRPLLGVSRKEILGYLVRNHIAFRTDPTNKDLKFFRNKIRHKLLPELEKSYNPKIKTTLANLAETTANDYDFIEKKGAESLKKVLSSKGKTFIELSTSKLKKLHPGLLRTVLRLSFECRAGETPIFNATHIHEVEDLIKNRPERSVVHLPNSFSVQKKHKTIRINYKKQIR